MKEETKGIKDGAKEVKKKIRKHRVNFFSKMSTKIGYLVIGIVIVPIAAIIAISISETTQSMEDTYMSYAQNLAEEAVTGVDFSIQFGEQAYGSAAQNMAEELVIGYQLVGNLGLSADEATMDKVLGTAQMDGVESSSACLVNSKGIILYHKNKAAIGQKVDNDIVNNAVALIASGKTLEPGYAIYDFEGSKKLAGYAMTPDGNVVIMSADYDDFMKIDYDTLIGGIEITGVDGSYAYMVSSDGTMLWHEKEEKIGKPVENAAVKKIVEDIKAGKEIKPDAVVYEYNGEDKLAGYAVASNGNIVVVTADYDTFMEPVTKQRNAMIVIGLVFLVICVAIGFALVTVMMVALGKIVPAIQDTAALNFKDDHGLKKLSKRKDEIGAISKEIQDMRENLKAIVANMSEASEQIDMNVNELLVISQKVNDNCSDNSATSEEVAAGMIETSSNSEKITMNIGEMRTDANKIRTLSNEGEDLSEKVMERAKDLRASTAEASNKTLHMYNTVKEKTEEVLKAAQAVNKISELTNTVMSISEQTSLLALNASIESARAGEAGRGFAVVATEIGNLSGQTSNAVNDINVIVSEIFLTVNNMTDCLKDTVEFLEKNVLKDYEEFGKVSEQYQKDAADFRESMESIHSGVANLTESLETIVDTLSGINSTVAESAEGVADIAEKTCNMVEETERTADKVDECKKYVADLNDIIEKFQL